MKKQKYKTMYMHTMDGQPAVFLADDFRTGLYFACGRTKASLHKNLKEIRNQQKKHKANLPPGFGHEKLGYILVRVPA